MGNCLNQERRSLLDTPTVSCRINFNEVEEDSTFSLTLTDTRTITETFKRSYDNRKTNQNFQKHCFDYRKESLQHAIRSQASVDPEAISFSQATRGIQNDEIRQSVHLAVQSNKKVEKKYGVYVCTSYEEYYENRDTLIEPYEVKLEEPDASWRTNAMKVKALLQKMKCSSQWRNVEHVGSTAIPGLIAKAIIDLMIVVKEDSDFTCLFEQFLKEQRKIRTLPVKIAFISKDPHSDDEWGFFQVPHQAAIKHQMCQVNIHMYRAGTQNVLDKLAFRNYLSSPEGSDLKQKYAELKRKLMGMLERNELSVGKYAVSKTEVITDILAAAKEWSNKHKKSCGIELTSMREAVIRGKH